MSDSRPIGVFDSGVGGLTVVRAILDLLPHERILYVGDNARFPYGPRPNDEIRAFALEIAAYLVSRDVKMLVVACNSVEVAALPDVRRLRRAGRHLERYAPRPCTRVSWAPEGGGGRHLDPGLHPLPDAVRA